MSSKIPIVVEPSCKTSARGRRGSEPSVNDKNKTQQTDDNLDFLEAHKKAFEKRFQRRHSVDPNTTFWKSRFESPLNETGGVRLQRRGSTPANLSPSQGRLDRFQQIIDHMMNADDDDLLSGVMGFSPFADKDQPSVHRDVSRAASFPVNGLRVPSTTRTFVDQPFTMNYGKSTKRNEPVSEIKIKREETMATDKEKQSNDVTKGCEKIRQDSKNKMTDEENSGEYKYTDDKSTKNASETEEKISKIKKIETSFKEIRRDVEAFNAERTQKSIKELLTIEENLMKLLMSLDAIEGKGSKAVREARKSVVIQVQDELQQLEIILKTNK